MGSERADVVTKSRMGCLIGLVALNGSIRIKRSNEDRAVLPCGLIEPAKIPRWDANSQGESTFRSAYSIMGSLVGGDFSGAIDVALNKKPSSGGSTLPRLFAH